MRAKRGCQILSFNPLREKGLESFVNPQHIVQTLINKGSAISTHYYQPVVGGDFAVLKGLLKAVFEASEKNPHQLDHDFISAHTVGVEELKADIAQTLWGDIVQQSGLTQEQILEAAEVYLRSSKTIVCWAMGLTQSKHAVITIQQIVNLLLLKGNIGKPGAGLCPVRGHSNVQGDRTMGIVENPSALFLDALENVFDFVAPRQHGYNTVDAIRAMNAHKVKVFIGMGGNFVSSTPDTSFTEDAIKKCELTAYISTKLNRSHLVTGHQAFILPCLGRTEIDLQNKIPQKVTVEDSMSMVHTSEGINKPASEHLLSEPSIVACMAIASLPNTKIDWAGLVSDYDRIRDKIESVLPAFENFNERLKHPGGFYLGNAAREKRWNTSTGKANFITAPLPILSMKPGKLRLTTIRSHDQYNTTIYGMDDRYRGVKGERKVIFLNESDMRKKNIVSGDVLDIFSLASDGIRRTAKGFKAIPYNIPEGCAAAYFPEANVLVPLNSVADKSHTPTSKFIEIEIERMIVK